VMRTAVRIYIAFPRPPMALKYYSRHESQRAAAARDMRSVRAHDVFAASWRRVGGVLHARFARCRRAEHIDSPTGAGNSVGAPASSTVGSA
jgi:hypothetical protein